MGDQRNLHQRLQEYCSCYVESDLDFELGHLTRADRLSLSDDQTEIALKYLALALLKAIESRANKLILARWATRLLGGHEGFLAAPTNRIVEQAIAIAKRITGVSQQTPHREFALGLRENQIMLAVEHRIAGDEEEVLFGLPSLRN